MPLTYFLGASLSSCSSSCDSPPAQGLNTYSVLLNEVPVFQTSWTFSVDLCYGTNDNIEQDWTHEFQ